MRPGRQWTRLFAWMRTAPKHKPWRKLSTRNCLSDHAGCRYRGWWIVRASGIAQRLFGDAIESLRKAEQLDPADSNVRELLQWANRGQDQEQRRKDLLDLTDQIHGALRAEDFSSAYTICEVGLGSFPNEPTLQRLKSIAEKQRDIAERRRFVQDQSLAAKELLDRSDFGAAIKMLEAALHKLPAEPNLEALLALARTESERQSQDQESQAAKEASERALLQIQAAQRQAATLRTALDERADRRASGKSCLSTKADADGR